MCTVRADVLAMTAAFTAARASAPMVNGAVVRHAAPPGCGEPCRVSTTTSADLVVADEGERARPESGPPNSSAMAVSTHGTASPRAAHAVA